MNSGESKRALSFVLRKRCERLVLTALGILSFAATAFSQSTISCPTGQWDMVQIMRMQTNWAQSKYYLSTDGGQVMYQVATNVTTNGQGAWTGGKLNYLKQYAYPPDGTGSKTSKTPVDPGYDSPEFRPVPTSSSNPKFWAYPSDVNLFDGSYVYLWITEVDWRNPFAYKKFNSGSSDYSLKLAPRCGIPGQIGNVTSANTSYDTYPPNVYDANNLIDTSNETFTSTDCKSGYVTKNLNHAYTQVNASQTGYVMKDHVNGTRTLDYVPVVYWYNCDSSYANCGNHEEFDYGFYRHPSPSTQVDYYGWVQWLHFTGTNSTPDQKTVFNNLYQWTGANDGHYDYSNVNFPAGACFQ